MYYDIKALSKKLERFKEFILNGDRLEFQTAVKVTVKILRTIKQSIGDRETYIMFSGGKDSLVLLDLTLRVFPKEQIKVLYIEVTGNTHEENVRYVKKVVTEYFDFPKRRFMHLRHDKDFFDLVAKWGWPGFKRRWCMNTYKRRVLNGFFKRSSSDKPLVFVGTKISDGWKRQKRLSQDGLLLDKKWWNIAIRPIAHFKKKWVNNYIRHVDIPLCRLYNILGESGNCVYCPFITSRDYYLKLYQYYPEWVKKMVASELKVKNGFPFIIASKKTSFRDILGETVYKEILEKLAAN